MCHFVLSQAPSIDEKVDLHFIALVNVDGYLYELGKNNCSHSREGPVIYNQYYLMLDMNTFKNNLLIETIL